MPRARNRPYFLLARFYDQLLEGVSGMNRHARGVILAEALAGARTACDLACGSGETALDLARRGLDVVAVDSSPTFLRIVREKAAKARLHVTLRRGDMRAFRLARTVDLLLCEFAALNNLDDRADLPRVFRSAARALRPGGTFAFDVNTPLAFRTQCAPAMFVDRPDFKLVLRCAFEDEGRRAVVTLEWFVPEGRLFRHARETIVHVAWSEAEIRRALRTAGFEKVRVFDGVDVRPKAFCPNRGTDLYFLARRRG